MKNLLIDNLIEEWKETVGLKIVSIEDYKIGADDPIELTVIHFDNGKFVIQRDQSYYTTTCGLVWKHDFDRNVNNMKPIK